MFVNVIIIAVIVVVLFFAVRGSVKHFKGEGGCCGGGSGKTIAVEKKLDKKTDKVVAEKILGIDGMKCDNCSAHVQNSLNDIDGVYAKVNLKKNEAVVQLTKEVSDDELKAAVDKAGYKVVSVKNNSEQ